MLYAKNLSLIIEDNKLLNNINLNIEAGSFVCLAGPNGSGKTLLLKTLSGLLKPSRGQVILEGQNISAITPRQRSALLRFLPAQQNSVFNYRALDIALMGTNPYKPWWADYTAADKSAALAALAKTGAKHQANRNIFTLSDGEQQRVFIAQALSGSPRFILPDEPTSHLDLKQKDDIFKLFLAASKSGMAVLCATHDIDLARKYATHICLIKEGRLFKTALSREITGGDIQRVYNL